MNRDELLARLPRGGVGVEVGVWKGSFSKQLLKATNPTHLYLIDPWKFNGREPRAWYGGSHANDQTDMDAIYEKVVAKFERSPEVRIKRMTSARAAAQFKQFKIKLDWVYIDGDHHYAAVYQDISLYRELLVPGGVLAGDDYVNGGWWGDGVKRAVGELLPDAEIIGTQFFWRKPA